MNLRVMGAAALLGAALYGGYSGVAYAADLGGDCCADLEERVAELEATTARKGNRKVSVQIYGQVTTALMHWDNGRDSDTYVVDGGTESSRFGLIGEAKIRPGLKAGFNVEVAVLSSQSDRVTTTDDDTTNPASGAGDGLVNLRKAYWYLQDDKLGKVSVGRLSFATDGITEIDVSGTNVAFKSGGYWANGIAINPVGTAFSTFANGNYEFDRNNGIRYDTATFAGFQASTAWGENDRWDIALRYAGEVKGFRIAAGVAYAYGDDVGAGDRAGSVRKRETFSGSASVLHVGTGLFVTGGAAQRTNEFIVGNDVDETFWHLRAGIAKNWFGIGNTALYGGYQHWNNSVSTAGAVNLVDAEIWGVGVVQAVDAAALELFLTYENHSIDAPGQDDTNVVVGGARIRF